MQRAPPGGRRLLRGQCRRSMASAFTTRRSAMATDGNEMGINTRLAHSGNNPHDYFGFVNPPVVHASTVLYPNASTMAARSQKYTYGTRGTPTTDALAHAIDALEGSAGTIIVPSG